MSLQHSPNIVTSGLVFCYDMSNTQKSWKGEPVTNQFICPDPYDSNNNVSFNVNGTGIFQRVYSGTYGGYTIKPTDVVYRYNLGGGGCHYHGNAASIATGQYVCYSVDYYISPDASDFPTDSTMIVLENYGGNALGGGTGVGGNTVMGKWQTIQGYSGPTSGSGTQAMFLYPGGCSGNYLASRGFVLMKNPMFEFRSNVKYNPFVKGARSNTQAVLDLTNNNTITAQSLTYASDGTFSFNGSSVLTIPNNTLFNMTEQLSIEAWVKFDGDSDDFIFEKGDVNTQYSLFSHSSDIVFRTYHVGDGGYHTQGPSKLSVGIVNGQWVHIVGSWDGATKRIYINSTLKNSIAKTGALVTTSKGASVGRFGGDTTGYYFNGSIAKVAVYNIGLTEQQVQQNFAAQRGRYGL